MTDKQRARKIIQQLKQARPEVKIELDFVNPLQLLVATILSAQCTDKAVNTATKKLFKRYRSAADFAASSPEKLAGDIASINYFTTKAKHIHKCCVQLVTEHAGQVPASMEALIRLPGIGRKTANVILGSGFGIASGIVVDTHVRRVSRRLEFTTEQDPVKIEQELCALIPKKDWFNYSTLLVLHGRYVCKSARPCCGECRITRYCPSCTDKE